MSSPVERLHASIVRLQSLVQDFDHQQHRLNTAITDVETSLQPYARTSAHVPPAVEGLAQETVLTVRQAESKRWVLLASGLPLAQAPLAVRVAAAKSMGTLIEALCTETNRWAQETYTAADAAETAARCLRDAANLTKGA